MVVLTVTGILGQIFDDLGPILGDGGKQFTTLFLLGIGSVPPIRVDQRFDFITNKVSDHGWAERIQLPAFISAEAITITTGASVAILHEVWRGIVLLDLIHVERDPFHLDCAACIERETLSIIAGHVDAVGIMVGEMQDQWYWTLVDIFREAFACLILQGLRVVAAMRKVRHAQLNTDAFDDSEECLLFYPYLWAILLISPGVFTILARYCADDFRRVIPGSMGVDLACPVLDCVPINQPAVASVTDNRAEPLVFVELVLQQTARDKLVIQLAECQGEPLDMYSVMIVFA